MQKLAPIIQPEELINLDPSSFILIDASAGSRSRFDDTHLTGALYMDLNEDLAEIKDFAVGGRHPLPQPEKFAEILTRFGISNDSHVIIYDDKNGGNAAARLWWMLKAAGHEKVQVVNGGFQAAIEAGYGTNSEQITINPQPPYHLQQWNLPLTSINEVEKASKDGSQTIIDVRDAQRFAGLTEPIDLIAGHIPGATNIPFTENLNEKGLFRSPKELREKYKDLVAEKTIVHCGSGVTACHTLLAIDYAGLPLPKLYVGSWSEWSRNNKEMVLAQ